MSKFFHDLQVDDVLRFRDFEGKVVRRLDDAVAVVDASGAETVLTFAELDRLKDETTVSYERITKRTDVELEVEELIWKVVTDLFIDLEKRGRTTRWLDDCIWMVVPQLNEAMLAEARRLRPLYGEWVRAEPGGVTPHCLWERLRIIESRRLLFVIPGGKA